MGHWTKQSTGRRFLETVAREQGIMLINDGGMGLMLERLELAAIGILRKEHPLTTLMREYAADIAGDPTTIEGEDKVYLNTKKTQEEWNRLGEVAEEMLDEVTNLMIEWGFLTSSEDDE